MRPIFATALLFATTSLTACAPDPRAMTIAGLTGDPVAGRTIYESTASPACASCHQADGNGNAAYPNLHGPARNNAVQSLATTIINGAGQMPAFGTQLSDQQIADVIAYIKMAFGS
jgi:mono/diheme cytochrome c family protein